MCFIHILFVYVYICTHKHLYVYMVGRELLLESIRTVSTECFYNSTQYKTILTRMRIPWRQESVVFRQQAPIHLKMCLTQYYVFSKWFLTQPPPDFPCPSETTWNEKAESLGRLNLLCKTMRWKHKWDQSFQWDTKSWSSIFNFFFFFKSLHLGNT